MQCKETAVEKTQWFDWGERTQVAGTICQYEIDDPKSGTWTIEVRLSDTVPKAVVMATECDYTSELHDQIRRKSLVWNPSEIDSGKYYHPISPVYVDDEGRLRYSRLSDETEVPDRILEEFDIAVQRDVVPSKASPQLRNKLVALVNEDNPAMMARLFIHEKVHPVL